MRTADCEQGQRVWYAGQAWTVSAIRGDRAELTSGVEVPIAELDRIEDARLVEALRGVGSEHEPPRGWQRGVWRQISSEGHGNAILVGVLLVAVVIAAGLLGSWLL